MLVQIRDQVALSSLSIVNLRAYLTARGWNKEGPWGERPATIYTKEHAGRQWDILVPLRETIADYAQSMAESVAVLAAVEERSQLDVFHDLAGSGSDVIRMRSMNGVVKEPLSLRQSTGLLTDAYNLLTSAARAAENPRAAYRGTFSAEVGEYLDNVWPLPGYHKGYDLTLHSPVPAGIGQADFGDEFVRPFPRRATYTLARALDHTSTAIADAIHQDTLDPFAQAVEYGVSANLCDAVAELAKKGRGIAIELVWADVRPSTVSPDQFPFSANYADILEEAAKFLRHNEPSFDEQIIAQVVQLEREPEEFDGKAIILSMRDARLIRLKVEFDRAVYDTVIQAFRDHSWIRLDGDIHLVGTGHELRNPRNVSLIPEAYG